VLVVPHIYYLRPDEEPVRRMADADGELRVASWLHPRAARWTLTFVGAACSCEEPRCISMGAFDSVAECADALADDAAAGSGKGGVEELHGSGAELWYPVLDRERCTSCGRCLDFCLFGVYSRDGRRVQVAEPDRCKPGCPACARVCPAGAVMFPHYDADPAIAGAPGARIKDEPIDAEAFLRLRRDGPSRDQPCPVCGCACDCARSTDGTAPPGKQVCPACGCICDAPGSCSCDSPADDLQDLIDALAEFDE
jgi:Pyruvate/2-oxoacid:ferredoxin oxidoreductase delta subunit